MQFEWKDHPTIMLEEPSLLTFLHGQLPLTKYKQPQRPDFEPHSEKMEQSTAIIL